MLILNMKSWIFFYWWLNRYITRNSFISVDEKNCASIMLKYYSLEVKLKGSRPERLIKYSFKDFFCNSECNPFTLNFRLLFSFQRLQQYFTALPKILGLLSWLEIYCLYVVFKLIIMHLWSSNRSERQCFDFSRMSCWTLTKQIAVASVRNS